MSVSVSREGEDEEPDACRSRLLLLWWCPTISFSLLIWNGAWVSHQG
jgi:hypothetical protein